MHGGCCLYIEELQIPGEERGRNVEHASRQYEVNEHGLQNLVPEVVGQLRQVQDGPHGDVVERVQRIKEPRAGAGQHADLPQHPQKALEPLDFTLKLVSQTGIEIMGIDSVSVLHGVAEASGQEIDSELPHKEKHVLVDGWYEGCCRYVEGNGPAALLRHVDRHGVAAQAVLRLEDAEVEPVRAVGERPGCPQSGHAAAYNRNPLGLRRHL